MYSFQPLTKLLVFEPPMHVILTDIRFRSRIPISRSSRERHGKSRPTITQLTGSFVNKKIWEPLRPLSGAGVSLRPPHASVPPIAPTWCWQASGPDTRRHARAQGCLMDCGEWTRILTRCVSTSHPGMGNLDTIVFRLLSRIVLHCTAV